MYDQTNPAGRLHDILQEAAKRTDNNASAQRIWAATFGLGADDKEGVLERLIELHALAREVRELVAATPGAPQELLLQYFPKLESSFLSHGLNVPWKNIRSSYDQATLDSLKFCAVTLSGAHSEEPIDEEELEKINSDLEILKESIISSSMPDALRVALCGELDKIRNALSMVRIRGAKGVKDALQSLVGAVIAHREELKEQQDENREILQRIADLMSNLDKIVTKSMRLYRAITSPVQTLIAKFSSDEDLAVEDISLEDSDD